MRPLVQAVPGALAELLRDVPLSAGKVDFAWRAAVGSNIQRVTSVRLEGRVLVVDVVDQGWASELERSSTTIVKRLKLLLGSDAVDRLLVRTR
jgi:hypothetical protein